MLQESAYSKGPRLPTSIQSTQDYYKNGDTTLMRFDVDHGSQEFSDLDVRISGSRDLGISGSTGLRASGMTWPGLVALAFNCVSFIWCLNTGAWQGAWPHHTVSGADHATPGWVPSPIPPWVHPGQSCRSGRRRAGARW